MSLYKTQRCRHFDEAGNPTRPYCSQGSKCRFIHPNDYQWAKLRRRSEVTPLEDREAVRSKGNRLQLSPASPPQHHHSSPLVPQTDLFKRRQKDVQREPDNRDWSTRNGDRRRDSDSRGHARERTAPFEQGHSLKRPNDGGDPYPNQRPRLSERVSDPTRHVSHGSASGGGSNNTRHASWTDKTAVPVPRVSERDSEATTKVSDAFHRLAKLCCEIVQDTCFLDRGEDRLKAFTGLSSELSRAVPDTAMAVTPALATVITGHTRTRERLESHVQQLETMWKSLFSMLEADICKVIDSRLEHAMTLLDKEKNNALGTITTRSQKIIDDRARDGTAGPLPWTDGLKEMATHRASSSLSGRNTNSVPVGPATPEEPRQRGGTGSLSMVATQEGDLGASLRVVLEDMKLQMDRQTRAIELLAKENQQLKSGECTAAQHFPPDSTPSSPRKPSVQ